MRIGEYAFAMDRPRNVDPTPPELAGVHDGLAYVLHQAADEPRGGVVILHGAGSCGANHTDFARLCAAAGLAAIVFDQRGHGASSGALGAGVLDDVAQMASLLPGGVPLFLRGSSMGGFMALATAGPVGARAVVAICPAGRDLLLGALSRQSFDFRLDKPALEQLLAVADLDAAVRALGPDLLLMHAAGDESVPIEHSVLLHGIAAGSQFLRVAGGDHGSISHDPEAQALALRFMLDRAG